MIHDNLQLIKDLKNTHSYGDAVSGAGAELATRQWLAGDDARGRINGKGLEDVQPLALVSDS
jgi:hypothetical protein